MKPILKEDISNMNDIIVELPPFRDLKSKDMIKEVFDDFLEEIYIKQLQELFDVYDNKLSERLQRTFFANYGIDKKYSRKIEESIKKKIAFNLEKLFQNKGSRFIFKMFAHLFENIYGKINFYNVTVYKKPVNDGFLFEYRLEPLYIQDESKKILYPLVSIEKTRKYLMELYQFKDEVIWPVSTNLVYIQFGSGEEIINNLDVFLNGIRFYVATYLWAPEKKFNFRNREGAVEEIFLGDIELIVNYIQIEKIKKKHPDLAFNFSDRQSTYLRLEADEFTNPTRKEFLCTLQDLIFDYQNADYRKRQELENIKRRWQFLLKKYEVEIPFQKCNLATYDDFYNFMENKYPVLQESIINAINNDDPKVFFELQLSLYQKFISGVYSTQDPSEQVCGQFPNNPEREKLQVDWVADYIIAVFNILFVQTDFLDYFFNPVMDLFIKYFFPVEMDYLNDLIKRLSIKDKWNAIGLDEEITKFIKCNRTSLQTPIRGIDYKSFQIRLYKKHSYIDKIDLPNTLTETMVLENLTRTEIIGFNMSSTKKTQMHINERIRSLRFRGDTPPATMTQFSIKTPREINSCFKLNRTKDYQLADLFKKVNAHINKLNKKENNGPEKHS